MALKDLLVYVDNSKANAKRVDAAIRLASEHGAHLTGLYVTPDDSGAPLWSEAHTPPEILEAQRKAVRERREEAEQGFKDAVERAGVSSEWRSAEGNIIDTLSLHARYADLVVIGQADTSDHLSLGQRNVEQIILDIGRPVLVVPYIGAPQTIGQRVIVAWNVSREAIRAIHDAMPLLERAQAVQVLSINPPRGRAGDGDIPGADISLHLARHGIKAEASHTEADDIAVGEVLLSRVSDQNSDLIVMGAYGHSRYRELVLGGATRQILTSMTVPVLMAR